MKTCDGEHQADAPCVTCDEDDKRCDYCWEDNPEDQHDDLKPFALYPDDKESQVMKLCPTCWKRAQRVTNDNEPPSRDWNR